MRIEITSLASLRAHRAADQDLRGALLTGLDLTDPEDDRLLRTALDGAVLLGCVVGSATARRAEAAGALLFPVIPELPYQVYRTALYTPAELFAGFDPDMPQSYEDTVDARIYVHSKEQGPRPDPLHARDAHALYIGIDRLLVTIHDRWLVCNIRQHDCGRRDHGDTVSWQGD